MKRKATAVWNGSGKDGKGHLTTQSTVLNQTQYSFGSRFEEGIGTNPEELVGAAHAGCFSMAFSMILGDAGLKADSIDTQAEVAMETSPGPHAVGVHLTVTATVPGIDAAAFADIAANAKENCVISKALSLPVTLDAKLV